MRQLLSSTLLVLSACSGAAAPLAGADPVLVELPEPDAARGARAEPVARSTIAPGRYALVVSTSTQHGCSRSWQSTSTRATATLEIGEASLSIRLDSRSNSTIGSRATRNVSHSTYGTSMELRGALVETGPRRLRATLAAIACEGSCPSGPLEITCEAKAVGIEDRAAPDDGDHAEQPKRTAPGWVCSGLGELVHGPRGALELPFGAAPGFEITASEWGAPRTFLAESGAGGPP